MCEKLKLDKTIWARYQDTQLNSLEQFCCECLMNISFTNPCPVCRGVENHKKVKKLPKIQHKRKYKKNFVNRDKVEKICSRCNKTKPTSEFYMNHRGQFEGRCKECKSFLANKLQKEKRKERNNTKNVKK